MYLWATVAFAERASAKCVIEEEQLNLQHLSVLEGLFVDRLFLSALRDWSLSLTVALMRELAAHNSMQLQQSVY